MHFCYLGVLGVRFQDEHIIGQRIGVPNIWYRVAQLYALYSGARTEGVMCRTTPLELTATVTTSSP